MGVKKLLVVWAVLIGLFTAGLVGAVSAAAFRAGHDVTVGNTEVIDHTLYAAGQNVDISGEVRGDIFCAGRHVTITAKVDGDIICAGQNINITGPVDGNVRVTGQDINISAQITRSVSAASSTFTLEKGAAVQRDINAAATTLTLDGAIGRDATVTATNIRLDGHVGRDVQANAQSIALSSGAVVSGDLNYRSPNSVVLANGAVAKGVTRHTVTSRHNRIIAWNFRRFFWGAFFYWLIATLVTAIILALLTPRLLEVGAEIINRRPGRTVLLGLATLVITPLLFALLFASLVGIPIGIMLLLLWLLGLALSSPLFAYFIGSKLISKNTVLLTMIGGSIVLLLAYWVPVLGFFAGLAAVLFGLGAFTTMILQRASHHRVLAPQKASAKTKNGNGKKSARK